MQEGRYYYTKRSLDRARTHHAAARGPKAFRSALLLCRQGKAESFHTLRQRLARWQRPGILHTESRWIRRHVTRLRSERVSIAEQRPVRK